MDILLSHVQIFFNKNFYYLVTVFTSTAFLVVFIVGIIWITGRVWSKFLQKYKNLIADERVNFLFITLLFLMVFTRFSTMYLNREEKQVLPEAQFAMDRVGRDLLDGTMQPAFALLDKKTFDPYLGYGQSLTAVVGLIVLPLRSFGICTVSQALECSNAVYKVLFVIIYFGFFLAVLLSRYGKDKISIFLIIITFYIGYSGSLGLDRGNLDILFSFLIFIFSIWRLRKKYQTIPQTVIESILLAFMANTKITILPLVLAFLLTSNYMALSISIFVGSFLGFSYAPLLLHMPASFLDPITAAIAFPKAHADFFWFWCQSGSSVLYNIATLAISCSKQAIAEHMHDYLIIVYVITLILFGFVTLRPLFPLLKYMWGKRSIQQLKRIYWNSRQGLFLLMLSLATAGIYLLPFFSYEYRLFFSLGCILAVWYSAKDPVSRRSIILSSLLLLVRGLWIQDSRLLNIVAAAHYYYLISAAGAIMLHQIKDDKSSSE